jgi:hypothetical protein
MKFNNLLRLTVAAIALCALTANAQLGFDVFKGARTLLLTPGQVFTAGNALVTNGPVDMVGLLGVGKVDFALATNSASTAITATLFTSTNTSGANLVQCSNLYYISGPTTITTSNYTYAYSVATNGALPGVTISYLTNVITAANSAILPYSLTTPSASAAGYSTPYGLPTAATNTGPDSLLGNSVTQIGLNVKDYNRYLYVVYAATGATTNANVSAIVTAPNLSSPISSGAY